MNNRFFAFYFIAIILGVVSGFSNLQLLQTFAQIIADIFVKLFKFISLPVISLSLIVTISGVMGDHLSKTWRKTLFYTLSTTLLAASISALLYVLIRPQNIASSLSVHKIPIENSYLNYLVSIVPQNILSPILENQVLSVLIISLLFGIGIRYIPDEAAKKSVIQFFKGFHSLFFILTKWLVMILPIGLFGFIATTIFQFKSGVNFGGIGEYMLVIVLSNLIQGFVILPIYLLVKGIKPVKTFRAMLPAISIAFFSKSSSGTLPITMETAEKNLKLNEKVSRFVLPLCTTINMNGCAAFIFVTVIYLMQNNGVPITISTILIWIFISTIAAIGNAGVPMGCFFLSASLLASMNNPIFLLGMILPFYSIIDMIETSLNVWSDSCVAAIIDKEQKMLHNNVSS